MSSFEIKHSKVTKDEILFALTVIGIFLVFLLLWIGMFLTIPTRAEAQTITKQVSWNKDTTAQPPVTKYSLYNNNAKVADIAATLNTANVVLSTTSPNSIQVSATNDIAEGPKSDPLIAAAPGKVTGLGFEN